MNSAISRGSCFAIWMSSPEVSMPVVDRLLEGPIRSVAAQLAEAAPGVDGEAMATLLVGRW